jgi:iron complex outermembrane recepter protein
MHFFWLAIVFVFELNVSGTVRDSSGGVLAGASVVAFDETGRVEVARATADESGRYRLTVPRGAYLLRASASLFQEMSAAVSIDGPSAVDFTLSPAALSESITVRSEIDDEIREVPGSVDYVGEAAIESSLAYNLKDALDYTPGVLVQPRFGADESQISIRGSGLRGNFHLRGLNVFVNGLPYQDADGFSDFESIDLMATAGIEVWKGANALRYGGNTMGGALNILTHTGETASPLQLWAQGGSFGHLRGQVSTGGVRGPFRYYASLSETEIDGYRDHSAQGRTRAFSNLGYRLDDKTDFSFDLMYADVSENLPGSLTKEEMLSNPRQADRENVAQDWGRVYDYVRVGAGVTREIGEGSRLQIAVSGQYRDMLHPIFQVLDNESANYGLEAVYTWETSGNDLVVGFSPQWGGVDERRYENVAGASGDLVAQFQTDARNLGFFFEDRLRVRDALRLVFGGRADFARREFDDEFFADGDRSDERTYEAFVPKVGFLWDESSEVQVYGNVSRSYEPPLLLELTSYGAPGFLDLDAQDAWQFEVGTRGSQGGRFRWDVAFFDAEISNEILNVNVQPFPGAPFTIPSYRNAERTRHLGLEMGASVGFDDVPGPGGRVTWQNAYTWSRFRFVEDPEFGGNSLPGAPEHILRTEVRYDHPSGLWLAPNLDWSLSSYFVDSANHFENDGYAVLNLRGGYDFGKFDLFFQGSNLTDRVYSGSISVDNAARRFYEPSNGRSAFVGIRFRL